MKLLNLTGTHQDTDMNITAVPVSTSIEISNLLKFDRHDPYFADRDTAAKRIASIGIELSYLMCEGALIDPPAFMSSMLEHYLRRAGFEVFYLVVEDGKHHFVKVD